MREWVWKSLGGGRHRVLLKPQTCETCGGTRTVSYTPFNVPERKLHLIKPVVYRCPDCDGEGVK